MGSQFEAVRVPTSEEVVYSYRYAPDATGQLYEPAFNYEAFRLRSLDLAEEYPSGLVVMTDVSDFFPRIYSHPLENAMTAAATHSADHARIIAKLLKAWNMSVSYGLPVGAAPFRLLAELTIGDVDQALLSEGITFCRFSDDYRLFAPDERTARESLSLLANVLFNNHGLTLQESKTEILKAPDFIERFSKTERDQERHNLQSDFAQLADQLGLLDDYSEIEYDELEADEKALVDSLNLWTILENEILADRALDVPLTRFVLGRIRQLRLKDDPDLLLGHLGRLAPTFREVIEATVAQSGLSADETKQLGARLLDLFEHPYVGYLEYHRDWLLTPFVMQDAWNHTERLVQLYNAYVDALTRRALILALGRGRVSHWFKTRKQAVFQMSPWERRAFLYAASCLPGDEPKHWYQSMAPRLDQLERTVVLYAKNNPLS